MKTVYMGQYTIKYTIRKKVNCGISSLLCREVHQKHNNDFVHISQIQILVPEILILSSHTHSGCSDVAM